MAYDEGLAERIREYLAGEPGLREKKMFGGLGFLVGGNMCCGISGDDLIAKVGAEGYQTALAKPHARPFAGNGRSMNGWVLVDPVALEDDAVFAEWVDGGVALARALPPK